MARTKITKVISICVCNTFFPCRNEFSTRSLLTLWTMLGFSSMLKPDDPIMNFIGQNDKVQLTKENYNEIWTRMSDDYSHTKEAYFGLRTLEILKSDHEWIELEFYNSSSKSVNKLIKRRIWITKTKIKITDGKEIIKHFNSSLDTKILVHGWSSNTEADSIKLTLDAYIQQGRTNIFAINWSRQAAEMNYIRPARFARHVGRAIAEIINFLVEDAHADSKKVHLIGHSVGAHVMGYAGSYTKYKVGRITGLDPASPGFEKCNTAYRLDETDADFVDIIHTSTRFLGIGKAIGSVDFYPNGGSRQPGCPRFIDISGCSHSRSNELFAESINSTKGFYANHCKTLKAAKSGKCSGPKILMGDKVPINATGFYYLKTTSRPKYALG